MKDKRDHDYGECDVCGHAVRERLIKQDFWIKDQLVVIDDVPAGVCETCGEKVVRADVARQIAQIVRDPERRRSATVISVPVIKFGKAAA